MFSAELLIADRVLGFNSASQGNHWADLYSPRYNITEPVCVQFKYSSTVNSLLLTLYTLNSNSIWIQHDILSVNIAAMDPGYWFTAAWSITDGLLQIDFTVLMAVTTPGKVDNVFVDDINVTVGVCSQDITTVETSGYHTISLIGSLEFYSTFSISLSLKSW